MKHRAWIGIVLWFSAGLVLVAAMTTGGGIDAFDDHSGRVLITAVAYGVALAFQFVVWMRYRKNVRNGVIERDEMDVEIDKKANGVALIVLLVYVYATCVACWEWYRSDGVVPVGVLYFLGYSAIIVGFLAHGVSALISQWRLSRDA